MKKKKKKVEKWGILNCSSRCPPALSLCSQWRELATSQVGLALEQPAPVGEFPAHGRGLEWNYLQGPFLPKPFSDSLILWNSSHLHKVSPSVGNKCTSARGSFVATDEFWMTWMYGGFYKAWGQNPHFGGCFETGQYNSRWFSVRYSVLRHLNHLGKYFSVDMGSHWGWRCEASPWWCQGGAGEFRIVHSHT